MKTTEEDMNDIFDSIGNLFEPNPREQDNTEPINPTQEIRDKNYSKMWDKLSSIGYTFSWKEV